MFSPKAVIIGSFLLLFLIVGLVFWQVARKQGATPQKIYRIAILVRGAGYNSAIEGYKSKMAEIGYIEGKNVTYAAHLVSDTKELSRVAKELAERR